MRFIRLIGFALLIFSGCAGPGFTNLGNGTGVPIEYVDGVAEENNITRDEARKRIVAEQREREESENQ